MQHAPSMTSRWKPCSPISHSCEHLVAAGELLIAFT
jgi:hypothetical protein